jgi:hypothetical protein
VRELSIFNLKTIEFLFIFFCGCIPMQKIQRLDTRAGDKERGTDCGKE